MKPLGSPALESVMTDFHLDLFTDQFDQFSAGIALFDADWVVLAGNR